MDIVRHTTIFFEGSFSKLYIEIDELCPAERFSQTSEKLINPNFAPHISSGEAEPNRIPESFSTLLSS